MGDGKDGKINLWKGLECHPIELTADETLEDLRARITPSIISEDDSSKSIWRFIIQVIEIDPDKVGTIPYDDAVCGKSMEKMLKALSFCEGRNTMYMADVNKATPDLIGLKTDKYMSGDLDVFFYKNDDLSKENFKPLLLERVRPLKNIATTFNNVIVCQEKTAIEIQMRSKGHGAFGFKLTSDAGDNIVERLYTFEKDPTKDAWTSISRYQKNDQAITVDSIKSSIPDEERYKHSRVNLEVWKVYSLRDSEGNYYDFSKPRAYVKPTPKRDGIVLPGDSIRNGTITGGEETGEGFGEIREVTEDREELIGAIALDLFVFASIEVAQKVFEINALPLEYFLNN